MADAAGQYGVRILIGEIVDTTNVCRRLKCSAGYPNLSTKSSGCLSVTGIR